MPATPLCPKNHQRQEWFVAKYVPTAQDNVWQKLQCSGRGAQLYQVPPHDVGDLIPYQQIRAWARGHGWKIPSGVKGCNGSDALVKAGGKAKSNGGSVKPKPVKRKKGKKHGN